MLELQENALGDKEMPEEGSGATGSGSRHSGSPPPQPGTRGEDNNMNLEARDGEDGVEMDLGGREDFGEGNHSDAWEIPEGIDLDIPHRQVIWT